MGEHNFSDEPECNISGRCEPAGETVGHRISICIHCGGEMHYRKYLGWVHWSHPDLGLDAPKAESRRGRAA